MPDIKVEVTSSRQTGGDLAPRVTLPESLKGRVSELGESIAEIANGLRAEIDRRMETSGNAQWDLDTVEMSFSLDLEAEAGVVVTRAKTSAGFEVTLTWKREKDA